jgi:hypothetical protein
LSEQLLQLLGVAVNVTDDVVVSHKSLFLCGFRIGSVHRAGSLCSAISIVR